MKIKTKQSKTEFQESQLPHNRRQVFWDVIKLHWRTILILDLVLFVGVLPLLACLFIRDNYCLALNYRMIHGEISEADRLATLKIVYLIAGAGSWVSLYVLAAAICVVTRFIGKLIWYDPIFVKEDIHMAFKNGYRSAFICATITGLVIIVNKAMLFVTDVGILQALPVIIFIPFVGLPLLLTFMQSTIYIGKFSQLLKNSVALYIKEAPVIILFGLLLFAPLLFVMLEQFLIVKYIILAFYLLFIENLMIMMFQLACNYVFDKYINVTSFPEIYNKGLYIDTNSDE